MPSGGGVACGPRRGSFYVVVLVLKSMNSRSMGDDLTWVSMILVPKSLPATSGAHSRAARTLKLRTRSPEP